MNQFQAVVPRPGSSSDRGGDPVTVKAAERLVGHGIEEREKGRAGEAVHYGFGAALGMAYGVAAEIEPWITAGFGLPYGSAVAVVADEALVPATKLSGPPWASPPETHAYAILSHLVFGAALEAARRVVLRVV
ncbi:DUF1440 domain-containing protein [Roseomonas sp. GCM10028921]